MNITQLTAVLSLLVPGLALAAPRVLYGECRDGVARKVLLLDREEFSLARVEAEAKRFLHISEGIAITNLIIFTDKMDATLAPQSKGL